MAASLKQLALKPQDLVVALKVAVNGARDFGLVALGQELGMALSAVHGAVGRCEQARLLSRADRSIKALTPSLLEFAVHGARYAFPPVHGGLSRGMPTSLAGPSLRERFDQTKAMCPVWPDALGDAYGPSLVPLHHTVPQACRLDPKLFDVLTLIDAVRAGAVREREIAAALLVERLS
jgi:hypothetical protein